MTVIVYMTPTCTWCKKLKEWLHKNRIKFEERDTTEESEWRDELLEKSNQLAVPVIDVDGKIIIGFDEKKFTELFPRKK